MKKILIAFLFGYQRSCYAEVNSNNINRTEQKNKQIYFFVFLYLILSTEIEGWSFGTALKIKLITLADRFLVLVTFSVDF